MVQIVHVAPALPDISSIVDESASIPAVATTTLEPAAVGNDVMGISESAPESQKLPEGSEWLTKLPLGDKKYVTDAPKKGYIYVCNVMNDPGGAGSAGPWIDTALKIWHPGQKIAVKGDVAWPTASASVALQNGYRVISSNGLPNDHKSGVFPIAASDPAYAYDRNPNAIRAQKLSFELPEKPQFSQKPGCIYGEVGIMLNGVMLFDGFDAGMRDAAAWEVQDECEAHPQVSGQYHYHNLSSCLQKMDVSSVVGFAFDGFPITGPKLPSGKYLLTKDLDECHGLTSDILLDGKKVRMYHYVLTQDFPYSVSCFKGKSVFKPQPQGAPGAGAPGPTAGGAPPKEALSACTGKTAGSSCSFRGARGETIAGVCDTPPGQSLACVPR